MRWMVRGDVDGFFGLALDNLVQLLLIDALCRFALGFPPELVYGRVLPGVGLTALGLVTLTCFGRVRFKGRIPGGMVAVGLGTLLAWAIGIAPVGAHPTAPAFHFPVPVVGDLIAAIGGGHLVPYLSVII